MGICMSLDEIEKAHRDFFKEEVLFLSPSNALQRLVKDVGEKRLKKWQTKLKVKEMEAANG